MKLTIKDIAQEAGVSVGTVSGVLHSKNNVKESTREKVLEVINRLQYNPLDNIPLARGTGTKTKIIGVITPSINHGVHPFLDRGYKECKRSSSALGHDCIMFSGDEIAERTSKGFASGIMADAMIFFCTHGDFDNQVRILRKAGIPSVLIRRKSEDPTVSTITDDDRAGVMIMLRHLKSLGHTRIGYIRYSPNRYLSMRENTYRNYCEQNGMATDPRLFIDNYASIHNNEDDVRMGAYLDRTKPTAIFCSDDQTAARVIKQLHRMGIDVPHDIAVTGYDNDYLAEVFSPGITTIHVPVEEMCHLAIRMVDDHFRGLTGVTQNLTVANRLVVRQSCGKKMYD